MKVIFLDIDGPMIPIIVWPRFIAASLSQQSRA